MADGWWKGGRPFHLLPLLVYNKLCFPCVFGPLNRRIYCRRCEEVARHISQLEEGVGGEIRALLLSDDFAAVSRIVEKYQEHAPPPLAAEGWQALQVHADHLISSARTHLRALCQEVCAPLPLSCALEMSSGYRCVLLRFIQHPHDSKWINISRHTGMTSHINELIGRRPCR